MAPTSDEPDDTDTPGSDTPAPDTAGTEASDAADADLATPGRLDRPAARSGSLARLPRRTVVISVAIGLVAAVVVGALTAAVLSDGDERPSADLRPAKPAPTDTWERFDGTEATFADYRGNVLVVNFFSSTCVPCKTEMPAFQKVHTVLGDQVTFVGMAVQDDPKAAEALVEQTGVTYETGLDPTGAIFNGFGGTVLPVTAFVAADGTILDVHTGELSADELREQISQTLLGGG